MSVSKNRQNKNKTLWRNLAVLPVAVMASAIVIGSSVLPSIATADQFDEQIKALRQQNAAAQANVDQLAVQADSYEGAIANLQQQINALQAQIDANTAMQTKLQQEIDEAQKELDRQRSILGEAIKTSYVSGQITTIEMLATSKSLSEFVDKEEYYTAVQNNIQKTLTKIAQLQNELRDKKTEVERLLADQRTQRSQLDASRAEQARLLAFNQSQQAEYSARIKENNSKISELKKQQAIENARRYGSSAGTVGGGGYPWGNAYCIHTGSVTGACYNYDWAINGNIWNYATGGYGYRNCTDWVAWRLSAPAGLGNANTWAIRARNMGYAVDTSPRAGDAAVDESGTYGHVMYVEDAGNDSVVVSDYNRIGDGLYRVTTLTKAGNGLYRTPTGYITSLKFVHF